jgi:outer membrane protein assembly factor BamB
MKLSGVSLALVALLALPHRARAGEWPYFRGSRSNNVSEETGLPSRWTRGGENMLWRAEWVGRSTPVVFDGRVCASGRAEPRFEVVGCWSAKDGSKLWERRFPVYNTTIPFTRVGWASVTADPETGYLYAQNGDGHLLCLDREGKTVWERRLGEEMGRSSGYGGRTHTPLVDGEQLIMSVVGTGWGDLSALRQRYVAFDKMTGTVNWIATPSDAGVEDFNNQANAVVAEIGGRRLIIGGGADGWVYALRSATGELQWKFRLSQKSLNSPVTVVGSTVYASSNGEPIEGNFLGQVVAIDGSGSGDITGTGRLWHLDGVLAGFAAPVFFGGRLYVVDDAANLRALDAKTGKQLFDTNLGTVGRTAPLLADGKIYATEVNGHVTILRALEGRFEVLDRDALTMPDGRQTELWGGLAAAYGRLYFMAEDGLYCLGDKAKPFPASAPARRADASATPETASASSADPASVQLRPAEAQISAGEELSFEVRAYDASGKAARVPAGAAFALDGLRGTVTPDGRFRPDPAAGNQAGKVKVTVAGKEAAARVRVFQPLPWSEGFEGGKVPPWFLGAGRFTISDAEGSKVLHKAPVQTGLNRATAFIGPASMQGYTIEADLRATKRGRRMPDVGLMNGGYTLDLQGNHQRLQVRSWASELAFSKQIELPWQPDVWYRMKLRVDPSPARVLVRGKVWLKSESEPPAWTIEYEDPSGIRSGAPGIYADSSTELAFDNVQVMVNP